MDKVPYKIFKNIIIFFTTIFYKIDRTIINLYIEYPRWTSQDIEYVRILLCNSCFSI